MDREYDRHKVLDFASENYHEYFSKDAEGFFGIFLSCFTQDEKLFETSKEYLKFSWDTGRFMRDFCLKFFNEFNEFEQYQICMKYFTFMQYENDEIREGFFDLGQKIAEDNNLFKEVA